MASLWKPEKGVAIKKISPHLFLFQFFHDIDLRRVLDGCSWTFDNHLLILHKLDPGKIPSQIPLFHVDFWVQVYDLRTSFMTSIVGKRLGNFIGRFVAYDDKNNSQIWRSYMRIRVSVDVRKPIKRRKKVALSDGKQTFITFKYEKLSTFCFVYGLLGHSDTFCELLLSSSEGDIKRNEVLGFELRGEDCFL
ncbi:hypothetical protein PTKIN_Ptkin07bG0242100 [Pterospermum kingtungense]